MDQEGTDCQGRQQAQQEKGYYAILLFRKAIKRWILSAPGSQQMGPKFVHPQFPNAGRKKKGEII